MASASAAYLVASDRLMLRSEAQRLRLSGECPPRRSSNSSTVREGFMPAVSRTRASAADSIKERVSLNLCLSGMNDGGPVNASGSFLGKYIIREARQARSRSGCHNNYSALLTERR